MSTNEDGSGSGDESSGFDDFCGFNLEEDLSEDSFFDDELVLPGKTYEYVNFVNPKYAIKENQKDEANMSDDELIAAAPAIKQSLSSTRSLKNLPRIKTHASKGNITNTSSPYLHTNNSNNMHRRSASPTPHTPLTPDAIREDAEEDNMDTYPSKQTNDALHGHIHKHSIHQHAITSTNGTTLERQDTTEIAAEHGRIQASHADTLNAGRKQILDHRRINRRYVWKDAEKYDIICLVASPCVKPNIHINQNSLMNQNVYYNQLSQSISHENSPLSYRDVFVQTKTVSINNMYKNISYNNTNNNNNIALNMNNDDLNDDLDILATVDDEMEHKTSTKHHHKKYESNSWSIMAEVTHNNNHTKIRAKSAKKTGKKSKKKKHKKKKTRNNNNPVHVFGEFVKSKKRDSKIIAASDSELLLKRKSKSHPELHRNKSVDSNEKHNRQTSFLNKDNNDILQHFDIKGLETLLYDGILCSIHQNARFLTLGGTVTNTMHKINGCKLLHYIGYAFNGKLLLESDDDVGLGHLFDPTNQNIIDRMTQCVVIQSPTHMEVANIFLNKLKVKHVVAIRQPPDNFAHHITDFITQFYFALIESNTTIARAFRTAFKLFDDSNYLHKKYHDTIYDDFKLLPENIDHELILFRDGLFDNGKPYNYSSKLTPHNNLHAIRPFIGRWNDVYKVMNMIRDKKLSIICSDQHGCGRTSIITMAARYLWERSKFKGGVFHIKNNIHKRINNLAELVLDALDVAEVDRFNEIKDYYHQMSGNYIHRSHLLAVELLYMYVNRYNKNKPICILFSDFDEITKFDAVEKFSFICALIERFDHEIENPPDIGTRIVITCLTKTVSQLQYFMDRIYKSQPQIIYNGSNNNNNNNYVGIKNGSQAPLKYVQNGSVNLPPVPATSTNGTIGGRAHSKSAPVPYNLNNYPMQINRYNTHNTIPMQYKRGHQVIKPLLDNDLIELFLQMIHIASAQAIYKFKSIAKHHALLQLFDHKPFRVKQIAEYVLQTFDDNLSRQQFQYEENEEADYGLVYEFEDQSDSESDEHEHDTEADELDRMRRITSGTSQLELKIDQFSDYTPIGSPKQTYMKYQHLTSNSDITVSPEINVPFLAITSPHNQQNKSLKSVSADTGINYKRRKSKLVKVVSIKKMKIKSFDSFRYQPRLSDTFNNSGVSFRDLLKGPPATRPSLPVTHENSDNKSLPYNRDDKSVPIHNINYSSIDRGSRLGGITNQSLKVLPSDVKNHLNTSQQNLLESTIVPSDDCHILLSRSTSAYKSNFSSRYICVDMAVTPLDCKKAFINKKIQLIHDTKRKSVSIHNYHTPNGASMDYYDSSFPNMHSYQKLPNMQSGLMKLGHMSSLQNIQSGVEHYYDMDGKLQVKSPDTPLTPLMYEPVHRIAKNKSTQRLHGHNKKNVSFSTRLSNFDTPHATTTAHRPKTLSTKLSRPKLRLENESIPFNARASTATTATEVEEEDDECIDEKIKAAWPCLDSIVRGFRKLEDERMIVEHNIKNNTTQTTQYQTGPQSQPQPQIIKPIQEEVRQPQNHIAHVPQHIQRRFKNMDPPIEELESPSLRKLYEINVSSVTPKQSVNLYDEHQQQNNNQNMNHNSQQQPRQYQSNQSNNAKNWKTIQKKNVPSLSPMLVHQNISYETNQKAVNGGYQSNQNKFHFQINGLSMNRTVSTNNKITAQQIWYNAGGTHNNMLCLDELMIDFYNYFTNKTKNQYLKLDTQSMRPLFSKFIPHSNNNNNLRVTSAIFNRIWEWFDCLCDIVNETQMFWNNKIASHHGFITRENAEKELTQHRNRISFGTFIIRFTAPKPNIVVTFNDELKQYTNNQFTHVLLTRTDNCDLYQNLQYQANYQKDKLKMWITKVPEFKYVFNKIFPQSMHKMSYFK